MSLHSDLLLHGSEANQSNRRRCGLTLRYCPADVRAGLGRNAKGVIVSGEGYDGHWANPSRPLTDWALEARQVSAVANGNQCHSAEY